MAMTDDDQICGVLEPTYRDRLISEIHVMMEKIEGTLLPEDYTHQEGAASLDQVIGLHKVIKSVYDELT